MASSDIKQPLVVITGPTASGKTGLAIELAKRFNGEIISADSRAVYKGMDVGTAKPTLEEREGIAHWGFDLINPDERFTAADFKEYALNKIADIRRRGRIPFLVGGTGLYVDSIIFDYQFGKDVDPEERAYLQTLSVKELQAYCIKNNIDLPENSNNKRYLVRTVEQKGLAQKRRGKLIDNAIVVGIATDKSILRNRIAKRAEHIFHDGVVEEAILLGKTYGWHHESMTGNIYPLIHSHQEGKLSYSDMVNKFATLDWRLAKRQLTWLRRNPYIWWGTVDEVRLHLEHLLANE